MINIRHTGIVVKDPEKMISFYRDVLGFVLEKESEETGEYINELLSINTGYVKTMKLADPNGVLLEFLYFKKLQDEKTCEIYTRGITHLVLTVDDVDGLYEKLKNEGWIH